MTANTTRTQRIQQGEIDPQQIQFLMGQLLSRSIPLVPFAEWAREWLRVYHQGRVKDNTYQGCYWEPVELHLIPYFGDKGMTEIMPIDIANFFKQAGKRLSLETLKKLKVCLNGIFETGVENGVCAKNPITSTLKLASKIPPKEKHVWNQREYDTAFAFARENGYVDIMVLMETAISRSELLGLTWADFAPEQKLLHLNNGLVQMRNSETWKLELVHDGLKNKYRHRDVPISSEITARLLSFPRVIWVGGDRHRHTPSHSVKPEFIFHAPQGGPFSPSNWYHRRFLRFIAELQKEYPDIPTLSPHELRHTRATLLVAAGRDIFSVAKLLGHSNLDMLSRRYAHENIDTLRTALDIK